MKPTGTRRHRTARAAARLAGLSLAAACTAVYAEQETPPMTEPTPPSCAQCPLPLSDAELKQRLTKEQYHVTREGGTEAPFANPYWNNKRAGLYVDVVTGEPLFLSSDKFDSRTGWPSFTRPVKPEAVEERSDTSHGMVRTEVRATSSGSHLGHLFDDGPAPTGMRYCINSAALRFIPLEDLEKEGYGQYRAMIEGGRPAR